MSSNSDLVASKRAMAQVVNGINFESRLVRIATVSSKERMLERVRDISYKAVTRWLVSAMELSAAAARSTRGAVSKPAAGRALAMAELSTRSGFDIGTTFTLSASTSS